MSPVNIHTKSAFDQMVEAFTIQLTPALENFRKNLDALLRSLFPTMGHAISEAKRQEMRHIHTLYRQRSKSRRRRK